MADWERLGSRDPEDPNLHIKRLSGSETGTGHPEFYEYRLPDRYNPDGPGHPLVVGWHGYSQSFHSVYVKSLVNEECNARNWIYVGFSGYNQCHFGHPLAQKHCTAVIWHLIHVEGINIDTRRI